MRKQGPVLMLGLLITIDDSKLKEYNSQLLKVFVLVFIYIIENMQLWQHPKWCKLALYIVVSIYWSNESEGRMGR